MQKVLHTKDVAVLFGISPSTVRRRARVGDFPARKRRRRWEFDPRKLAITWNAVMSCRKPSPAPVEDFQRFRELIERIERRDVPVYEDAQREVLDLALSLLATEDGFRAPVWRIIQRVRYAAGFGFLEMIPDFVPIY